MVAGVNRERSCAEGRPASPAPRARPLVRRDSHVDIALLPARCNRGPDDARARIPKCTCNLELRVRNLPLGSGLAFQHLSTWHAGGTHGAVAIRAGVAGRTGRAGGAGGAGGQRTGRQRLGPGGTGKAGWNGNDEGAEKILKPEQIECTPPACLAPRRRYGGVDPAEGSRDVGVDRQRIERGFGSLQTILAAGTLGRVGGGMGSRGKFRQCDRRDRDLDREIGGIDPLHVDNDGRVDQPLGGRRSHGRSRADR